MSTPTPRTALKATGVRRRDARCPEAELATLTAERDHWQKIAVSASHEREHNANVAQAMTAERDQLRAERDSIKQEIEMVEHRAYRAEVERDQLRAENATFRAAQKACEACDEPTAFEVRQLRAEVERLGADRDCEKRLRKDADEFRENAIERAQRAEANLAALEQSFDDNCRGVVKIADELAKERARLDWLEENAGDIPKYNSRSFIWFANQNIRAAIDVAIKEDAK